jgi:hypothetical protein
MNQFHSRDPVLQHYFTLRATWLVSKITSYLLVSKEMMTNQVLKMIYILKVDSNLIELLTRTSFEMIYSMPAVSKWSPSHPIPSHPMKFADSHNTMNKNLVFSVKFHKNFEYYLSEVNMFGSEKFQALNKYSQHSRSCLLL